MAGWCKSFRFNSGPTWRRALECPFRPSLRRVNRPAADCPTARHSAAAAPFWSSVRRSTWPRCCGSANRRIRGFNSPHTEIAHPASAGSVLLERWWPVQRFVEIHAPRAAHQASTRLPACPIAPARHGARRLGCESGRRWIGSGDAVGHALTHGSAHASAHIVSPCLSPHREPMPQPTS